MNPIYLDHAAATPLDPMVRSAMLPYLDQQFYNPSAQYLAAKQVRADIEAARARIATWLGVRPIEVIFAAGGTEADNIAIHGVMNQFPEANCIVSAVEHNAVLKASAPYHQRIASVLPDGTLDLAALDQLIDDNTVLLSIMYANNELGTIQPIRKLAEIVQNHRSRRAQNQNSLPLYLHTDACQATPYLDLHVSRLGVDMMTINASKMYGPKQVGALYVKTGTQLSPFIFGGGQERGLRSGTENVPGIIGLAAALDVVQGRRHDESRRLAELQRLFYALIEQKIPTAAINGSTKHRLPNNVHLTISSQDNERLMMLLDEAGVQVAVGSACSASSDQPSHVLAAIGLSDEAARASLRLTMGHFTDENAIRTTVDLLAKFTTNGQE